MFYHALTGGNTPTKDLLWTNPTPTANFEEQKISVDLSNAKGVVIEFMIGINNQTVNSRMLAYKGETNMGVGYTAGTNATSRNVLAIEDDGVTFGAGWAISAKEAGLLIPYKIYAIH